MKNRKIQFVLFFFCMGLSCFANEFSKIALSLEPLFGYQYGVLYEYVYIKTDDGGSRILSELDWKNKLLYAGGNLSISYSLFHFFAEGGAYIPMRSGTIEDSDWLNDADHSMKTNFSISENSLKSGGFFSTGFYASLPVARIVNVNPKIAVDLQKKWFSAKNGYGWYGDKENNRNGKMFSWDDENATYYENLLGIDYERLDFTIWTGLSIDINPVSFICLNFSFDVSFFSLVDSLDTHFGSSSNSYYYDKCYDFFSFGKAYFGATFSIGRCIALKAGASYSFPFSKDLKGTTYASSKEVSGYGRSLNSVPGASSKLWDFSISIIFKDLQKIKPHSSHAKVPVIEEALE